jgi:hypothetical protein
MQLAHFYLREKLDQPLETAHLLAEDDSIIWFRYRRVVVP